MGFEERGYRWRDTLRSIQLPLFFFFFFPFYFVLLDILGWFQANSLNLWAKKLRCSIVQATEYNMNGIEQNNYNWKNCLRRKMNSSVIGNKYNTFRWNFESDTHFFSRFPAPVSRNPFANGLLSIFNWVICNKRRIIYQNTSTSISNGNINCYNEKNEGEQVPKRWPDYISPQFFLLLNPRIPKRSRLTRNRRSHETTSRTGFEKGGGARKDPQSRYISCFSNARYREAAEITVKREIAWRKIRTRAPFCASATSRIPGTTDTSANTTAVRTRNDPN